MVSKSIILQENEREMTQNVSKLHEHDSKQH